jgi:hypothetical protein
MGYFDGFDASGMSGSYPRVQNNPQTATGAQPGMAAPGMAMPNPGYARPSFLQNPGQASTSAQPGMAAPGMAAPDLAAALLPFTQNGVQASTGAQPATGAAPGYPNTAIGGVQANPYPMLSNSSFGGAGPPNAAPGMAPGMAGPNGNQMAQGLSPYLMGRQWTGM